MGVFRPFCCFFVLQRNTEPSTLVANGPLTGVEAAVGYQDGSLSLHALGSAAPVSTVRLATQNHVLLGLLLQGGGREHGCCCSCYIWLR